MVKRRTPDWLEHLVRIENATPGRLASLERAHQLVRPQSQTNNAFFVSKVNLNQPKGRKT